jgi:hypothetical protein
MLPACLGDLRAHLDLLEDADCLRFAESCRDSIWGNFLLPRGSGFRGDFNLYNQQLPQSA